MIQQIQTATPVGGVVIDEQAETATTEGDVSVDPAQTAPAEGDPLAQFGSMHGVHADVQRFAYAAPGNAGGGGAGGGTTTNGTGQANSAGGSTDVESAELKLARKEAQACMTEGNRLLREHRYSEAIAVYEEGFRIYPDQAFLLNKASALHDAGRHAEAVHAYERYLSNPEAPRADEARAAMERSRAALGGREPTIADIEDARKLFEAGAKAASEGRYQEALDAFTEAYEKNPLAEFKFNQGTCLEKLGRKYAAANAFESYVAAKPDAKDAAKVTARVEQLRKEADAQPITAEGRAGAMEWMNRGNRLLFAHRYKEAIAAYDEGFRTYPDRAFLLNKAAAYLDSGHFAEAVLAYENYLSDPEAPRADEARAAMERAKAAMGGREATATGIVEAKKQFEAGASAFAAGRFQEALEAFEKAYELNPLADFKFNQAACLEKLGRPYAAADRLEAYLAAKRDAKDAAEVRTRIDKLRTEADKKPITLGGLAGGMEWMSRGNRLLQAHRPDEAVAAFQEGFRTYPDEKFILNEASALLDAGRWAEADLAYQRYLSNPDAPRADEARAAQERARSHMQGREANVIDLPEAQRWFDRAEQAFKAGRYEEALAGFEKAYEYKPYPQFKYNQAMCLQLLSRNYAAVSRYSQYLAEAPNAHDAGKVRGHIAALREKADTSPITAQGEAGGYEWMVRGMRLLDNYRRPNDAVEAFREGFRTYPDRDFIRYEAKALLAAGRYAEADLVYQIYLSDPKAPHAESVGAEQQRAREAMGGREATATGVADAGGLQTEGVELYKKGRYGDALLAFERAYQLDPRGHLRYNQAACLERMGLRELAAQRYESYLKETPNADDAAQVRARIGRLHEEAMKVASVAFTRGETAFNAGRFKEAAAAFAEAYEQKPYPQFLYNVAASYDKGGEKTRAVQYYQLYLSMFPEANDAAKVRERIQQLLKSEGRELLRPGS